MGEPLNPRSDRSKVSPDELTRLAQQMQHKPGDSGGTLDLVGGARTGWLNFSYPLARLKVQEEDLSLQVFIATYELRREEVVAFGHYRGWFFRGIEIEHSRPTAPRLIFWPAGSVEAVLEQLEFLGWPVAKR